MKFVELVQFSRDADKYNKVSKIPEITHTSQFIECMDNMMHEHTRVHEDHALIRMVNEYVRDMKYRAEKYNADKYVADLVALDRHIRQDMNGTKGMDAMWRISSKDKEAQRKLQRLDDELQKTAATANITAIAGSTRDYKAASNSIRHNKHRTSSSSSSSVKTHICYKYNGENGKNSFGATVMCTHTNCKYKHICIICKGEHSRCNNAACKDAETTPHHRP
jgi:hypothetical protein